MFPQCLGKMEMDDPAAHFVGAFIAWPKEFAKKSIAKKSIARQPIPHLPNVEENDPNQHTEQHNEGEKPMLPCCQCKIGCQNKIEEAKHVEIHRSYWDKTYKERRA